MQNIKLTVAYAGSRYAGWQIQRKKGVPTIQGEIEGALRKIFHKKTPLIGCGRTDSGVHAICQTANFKLDSPFDLSRLKPALNHFLPADIAVVEVQAVRPDFHARFCAQAKTYRYLILNKETKEVFLRPWALWIRHPLDITLMRKESRCLLGRHNFKSFQASDTRKRCCITTIRRLEIKRHKSDHGLPFICGAELISIDIEAEGFLRGMMRNIAGTLIEIGRGKIKKGELKLILEKKDRRCAGPCAPAHGLYLIDVRYD